MSGFRLFLHYYILFKPEHMVLAVKHAEKISKTPKPKQILT